ncbi:MAG: hypothetical protein ACKUBY_02910 [Candidatus Moraniibacteriota bacterium]|jgi:hypothetical protein
MISVGNIERFIDNHPELNLDKDKIMRQADELARQEVLSGGVVGDLLGNLDALFFREFHFDIEHLKVAAKDVINME